MSKWNRTVLLYHNNTNYHKSKQRTTCMQGKQMAFSLLNVQNIFLPLAMGKVLFREGDAAAAPGGQSGDVPEGLCL